MSYQALYRVYRPQRFGDLVGQDIITQTLKHAISEGKSSHAYLFTGPRGTGKTSAAKIFAKAINCPNSENGEPCNQCSTCQEITSGASTDVIEIDAASNNGIEEIRDIREKANYAPTQTSYKVYIIDEVHMLSQGAFNALLKTLEEPPQSVVFILATTEPHKIPLTVISRTQRFDFKRIKESDMVDRMTYILDQESVDYEPEMLDLIAQNAEGGMRDALSILDQTLSFSTDKVKAEDALTVMGALTQDLLEAYLRAIYDRDTQESLKILEAIVAEGKDPGRFVEDMILFCRDMLVFKQVNNQGHLLKRAQLTDSFANLSAQIEDDFLYRVIKVFSKTQQELKFSNQAMVYLELASINLSQKDDKLGTVSVASQEIDTKHLEELEQQVASLQNQVGQLSQGKNQAEKSAQEVKTSLGKRMTSGRPIEFRPNKTMIFKVLEKATREDLLTIQDLWSDLIATLSASDRAMAVASKPVAASPEGAVISFQYEFLCQRASEDQSLQNQIKGYFEKVLGRYPQLTYLTFDQWPTIRQEFIDQMDPSKGKKRNGISQDLEGEKAKEEQAEVDIVDQAIELFGQDVVQVKDE